MRRNRQKYRQLNKLPSLLLVLFFIATNLSAPTISPSRADSSDARASWQNIADDLEMSKVQIWPSSFVSPEILFLRTSLKRYRPGVIHASDFGQKNGTARSLSRSAKAVAGINANFFDENGKALGLIVSRGSVLQKPHRGGRTLTGVFQYDKKGISIINRSEFKPLSVFESVQAGPRLLIDGKVVDKLRDSGGYSRRAGLCIDQKKRLVLFISTGIIGITIEQVVELLKRPGIDCVDALNLDGGGSAQLYISKDLPGAAAGLEEMVVLGRDNVPVVLGLFIRH